MALLGGYQQEKKAWDDEQSEGQHPRVWKEGEPTGVPGVLAMGRTETRLD